MTDPNYTPPPKMKRKEYERELQRLQIELVKLQQWIKHKEIGRAHV